MINQNKIILMSRLALEDKKFTEKDRKITSYYLEDYVYVNNLKTRIVILVVVGIIIAGEILYQIEKGLNIPTTIREWVIDYIIPYGGVVVMMLVMYTFFSTIVYTKKYSQSEKKRRSYQKALEELQEYEKEIKGGKYDSR